MPFRGRPCRLVPYPTSGFGGAGGPAVRRRDSTPHIALVAPLCGPGRSCVRQGHHPLKGRWRAVIAAIGACPPTLFSDSFLQRLKEVGVEAQGRVEVVEPGHLFGTLIAQVADIATDDGPIFLLDVNTRHFCDRPGTG